MSLLGSYVLGQILGGLGAKIVGQQVKFKGHGVVTLGISIHASVRGDVALVKSRLDVSEERFVFGRLFRVSDRRASLGQQTCRIGKIGSANEVFGGIGPDGEPVTIIAAAV